MNNRDYIIQRVQWSNAHADLRNIRAEVFMLEQQVSAADEWDGKDESATHFLVSNNGFEKIATARVLTEQDATGRKVFHIGRVAVRKSWRDQGVGHALMQTVIDWCLNEDINSTLYLHAQTSRKNFYARLGFVARSEEFMDAGIPHVAMWYAHQNT